MSMIYIAKQASDQTISKLLADPSLIQHFVSMEADVEPVMTAGWLGRLFDRQKKQDQPPKTHVFDEDAQMGDLDKAWHGLHYLFTGTAWEGSMPASFLLVGGATIGSDAEHDVGYGCARAYTAQETCAILAFLRSVDNDVLRARFDPEALMRWEIYPTIWNRDPADDDTLGYLLEYYESFKEFVSKTVERQFGMVVWLG